MNRRMIAAAMAAALSIPGSMLSLAGRVPSFGRAPGDFRKGAWLRAERKRRRKEVNASQRRNRT